ncbi:OmpA family protein [Shewanella sp. 1_MG-2023]|uniref:OmpA family protein n=1 Tax=Shewanella electrodiphila TaxID=934143 RepID=A0ABT0KLZ6_9GAMM|nr:MULTISPECIES: OmpA family protein [Shewanella]MCC4832620.1 OmpA family protein [Shewanella sp. 10N.7]MCL1044856.1 OmpA family protein [Shewanella electrodiphila]MDO6612516.1 OmpA family protein [Shewanella sp. 7_MG-2023]MDO6772443.1 OmpA family protein [Shewanella sp. 2_MG-2023]MDO6794559.1 OmpA family protein [Shewanella sp. 1_MG-2023]
MRKILVLFVCLSFISSSYAWVDTDRDGVPDKKDACPDTPLGVLVLANGCQDVTELAIANNPIEQNSAQNSSLKVYFDFAQANVLPTQLAAIKQMIPILQKGKGLLLVGHTDDIGSEQTNLNLSLQRAESVKKVLVDEFAFEPSSLAVQGKGSLEPVADNKTAQQRQLNRRVEFKVEK